jgi:transcriptional regulator with XRE-family HTH domain
MKASEWIDRVKTQSGITSDYGVAKALGLSRTTVSKYRSSTPTLDEDTAIRVAQVLGERPEAVLLDQYAERTKAPEVRAALLDAAKRLCILCKVPNAMEVIASYARASGVSLASC